MHRWSFPPRLVRYGRRHFPFFALLFLGVLLFALTSLIPMPESHAQAAEKPAEYHKGMVVSVSPPASDVGLAILKDGGNAVDAAVATALALAVTYPAAGNIGGGGFMLVYPGGKEEPVLIDYRETAPAAATKTMFKTDDSWYGHKCVGVPGTVRGLALAHKKFGKLPWKQVAQPAIDLADKGFILDGHLAGSLNSIVANSKDFPELRRCLGKKSGEERWETGDRFSQPDLAKTLKQIAEHGPEAFYKGEIADQMAEEMKKGGGLITKADLEGYEAKVRTPIHGTYRGYDVFSPPPPSSGGTCLVEMLNILENFDLKKQGRWSPDTLHLMIESMRRAYRDRACYLGDPAFVKAPAFLTSKEYAKKLADGIDRKKATPSEDLAGEIRIDHESDSTTHFSVIDKDGMAVANTFTLERSYGSRVVVKGAGFLLNDEMIDFNWRPGVTDSKGGIGTDPNIIAPGKRMLSSQTPTILARDGKAVLITGSPGSRTIINTVLCIVVNVVDFDMDIQAAVDAPRLHHQWFPDEARFEAISDHRDSIEALRKMGHKITGTGQGDAHSIWIDPKTGAYKGAADRRINGKAAGY